MHRSIRSHFIHGSLAAILLSQTAIAVTPDLSVCVTKLRKIPRRGIAPAYSIKVQVQNFRYRITLALRRPSSQSSSLLIQVFWEDGLRDGDLESFLIANICRVFRAQYETDMGRHLTVTTESFDRDGFHDAVRTFIKEIKRRISSTATVYRSVSPVARSRSPEVSEAARMMTGLLRRSHVVNSTDEADRILNRVHARLIHSLTERELRFFDYSLFDEVIPYEKDAQMQRIANATSDQVAPADLDYPEIHAEIRTKFVEISRELIERQRSLALPHIESVKLHLAAVNRIGNRVLALFPPNSLGIDENPNDKQLRRLPFSRVGFERFAKLLAHKQFNLIEIEDFLTALEGVKIQPVINPESSQDVREDIVSLRFNVDQAHGTMKFLAIELEQQRRNEPTPEFMPSRLMSVSVHTIAPGNGRPQNSAYVGMEMSLPRSFIHQPRRLNSGPGNRQERLDYDTPEFD